LENRKYIVEIDRIDSNVDCILEIRYIVVTIVGIGRRRGQIGEII